MGKRVNRALFWENWPAEDQHLWTARIDSPDIFDDQHAAKWSAATKYGRKSAYGQFLGYVANHRHERLALPLHQRADRQLVADYAEHLLRTSRETSVSIALGRLAYVLIAICPDRDWSWIQEIASRIRRRAKPMVHKLVPIEDLDALATDIMDQQIAAADAAGAVSKGHAEMFRDGLLLAFLANFALRRGTLAGLNIGSELVRAGPRWVLDIPAEKTKAGRALDYELSERLSRYVDLYLSRFRPLLPAAHTHTGLWPAVWDRPMPDKMIYRHINRLTKKAFGFSISPHRFRNAAATLWSVHDPKNVRIAKDLLDHVSFRTTEKYYIQAQSRIAGQALAGAISRLKSQPGGTDGSEHRRRPARAKQAR
jgi:integrase